MRALIVACGLLAAFLPAAFAQGLEVEIVDGREFMVAFEINDDMLVCGDNQINSTTTAVVWEPLVGADILPGADGISQAGDINAAGDVVGWFSSPSGLDTAVVWYADGGYTHWTEIGLPPAVRPDTYSYTQGYAINNLGEIVLQAGLQPWIQPDGTRLGSAEDPYLWSESGGFVALEHLSGARDSAARDINDAGLIVGSSATREAGTHAVTWDRDGRLTDLGTPEGVTDAFATAVNEAGTIVGYTGRNRDSWIWTREHGFRMLEDFGFNAIARDINDAGVIAGVADLFPFESVPVVWDANGKIHDVRDAAGFDRYFFFDGIAINNDNVMVVYGVNLKTGRREAVVLRLTFTD